MFLLMTSIGDVLYYIEDMTEQRTSLTVLLCSLVSQVSTLIALRYKTVSSRYSGAIYTLNACKKSRFTLFP